MSQNEDLLHVAHARDATAQQPPHLMQQRQQQARNSGPSLKALAEGILTKAARNSQRNNSATDLLHSHSAEGVAMQQAQQDPDRLDDHRDEARRQGVLRLVWSNPDKKIAIYSDDDTTDPVMLAVAIRKDKDSTFTCALAIPKEKYDAFAIMELATTGKRPELAVIDGDKAGEPQAA